MKLISLKKIHSLIGKDNTDLLVGLDKAVVSSFNLGKDTFYKIESGSSFYKLNRLIAQRILPTFPVNNAACAYVKGKSYFDFLYPHRVNSHFIRLDIKGFFPSIQSADVMAAVTNQFDTAILGTRSLSDLVHEVFFTVNEAGEPTIPIGFPTSPAISNIIFRKIDIQIQSLCERHRVEYTRYADDLLFSSLSEQVHSEYFQSQISFIISQLGFRLNDQKTIKTKNTISLNGYKILGKDDSQALEFSNKKLKVIRHLIHLKAERKFSNQHIMKKLFDADIAKLDLMDFGKTKFINKFCDHQILNKLQGFRSHLLSLIVFSKSKNCITESHKKLLTDLVTNINQIIDKEP
jgi:RNA-directed DNA polymerase